MAMTWDDVVALGRELPEVDVSTSYGTPALKVNGKLLTRLRPEDGSLVLPSVPAEEQELLITAEPRTFHTTAHYDGYAIVLARMAEIDPARLQPFLERQWRAVAPKRIALRYDASVPQELARRPR